MRDLDQHFTEDSLAENLTLSVIERLDPHRKRFYIEPCCGGGAFVKALQKCGVSSRHIRAAEIDAQFSADVHCDFLASTRELLRISRWQPDTTVIIVQSCNRAIVQSANYKKRPITRRCQHHPQCFYARCFRWKRLANNSYELFALIQLYFDAV